MPTAREYKRRTHGSRLVGYFGAYVGGTLRPGEPDLVFVDTRALDGVQLNEAERVAHEILAVISEARSL